VNFNEINNIFHAMFITNRTARWATCATLLLGAALPAAAAPYPVTMEPELRLSVRPVVVDGGDNRTFESRTVEIRQDGGGSLRLELAWPDPDAPSRVDLHFTGAPSSEGREHTVRIQSAVSVAGEADVIVDRQIALEEGALRFVEVYARGGRHMTLALTVESVLRPVVLKPSGKELPVRFRLEVHRVTSQGVVPLETDTLHTLIGQQVSYSFRRGDGDSLETVRLDLTPLKIRGDLLEVRFELRGEIRTASSPLYLSRSETLFTGRSTVSEFQATSGEPPLGYLFTVSPLF
jgi:hypothetical protein